MVVVRLALADSREMPGRRRAYISLSALQSLPTRLPGTTEAMLGRAIQMDGPSICTS